MSSDEKSYALILGLGQGLGGAFARACYREGHILVLVSRSAERMSRVVDAEKIDGNRAYLMEMDLTDLDHCRERFENMEERNQVPRIVIYNAAALRRDNIETLRTEELLETFTVNVAAALQTIRSFVPAMAERGGSIILVGGGFYTEPHGEYASLSIGKAGLRNLAHTAHDWARKLGVQVTQLTVGGYVAEGTPLDRHRIAARAIEETKKPREEWVPEVWLPEKGQDA
ncbi:MAG: SDR family NAD(P)-dependent oxidoreductase [Alkalispirochaetaceae bacterium]